MAVQLDEFKTRQREVWGAGDYATLSEYISDIGERVVRCGAALHGRALNTLVRARGSARARL